MDVSQTPAFVPLRLRLQPGDHVIDLTSADILLGRQSDADLRMPQPDVSRQHCRFQFAEGDWRIVDLDSMNGVYVNGTRVRRMAVIHAGDHIRICGIEFNVETPPAGAAANKPANPLERVAANLPQQTITRIAS
jgi:pSer/pThr/pTyr-binding forkhead associated (FHA) protein